MHFVQIKGMSVPVLNYYLDFFLIDSTATLYLLAYLTDRLHFVNLIQTSEIVKKISVYYNKHYHNVIMI